MGNLTGDPIFLKKMKEEVTLTAKIDLQVWNIIDGLEVRIEKSVLRVTVQPRDAKWRNFQFEPNNHYRFFFLRTLISTTAFRLDYILFYQFYAKITTFFLLKKCLVRLLSYILTSKGLAKTDVKMTLYWCHAWELSYTPHVRRLFLAPVGFMEILVGYARNKILAYPTGISARLTTARKCCLTPGAGLSLGGRFGRNNRSRGQNFALNWTLKSGSLPKKKKKYIFFFFRIFIKSFDKQAVMAI